ncbi:MAG: RsmB/NOP family class I SAM-dependent RNA methyltransferase, partial [Deinococcales bacterium]
PSAQAVALAAGEPAGLRVLDLCAAPGGKSTHLAARMHNAGLLVCNEIHPTRARALQENLERLGCIGAVTSVDPALLAQRWGAFFDLVLLDAPCSGEGMFRKHDAAIAAWSQAHVEACVVRQSAILESAAKLVRGGGKIIYSTCTFSPEENEDQIARFLKKHNFFSQDVPAQHFLPHLERGEGHFVATLTKNLADENQPKAVPLRPLPNIWREFEREFSLPQGVALEFKGNIEIVHPELPSMDGIKALRLGVPVAQLEKNRLEPHHALAKIGQHHKQELELHEVAAYLRGETLSKDGAAGWVQLCFEGFGLGWGKRVAGTIKNHYPRRLRGQIAFED